MGLLRLDHGAAPLKQRLSSLLSALADIIWRVGVPAKCALLRVAFLHSPLGQYRRRRLLAAFLDRTGIEELLRGDYSGIVRVTGVAEALLAFLRRAIRSGDATLARKTGLLLLCHGTADMAAVRHGLSSLSAAGLLDEFLADAARLVNADASRGRARSGLAASLGTLRPDSSVLDSLDDGCIRVLEMPGTGTGAGTSRRALLFSPVSIRGDSLRGHSVAAGAVGLGPRVLVLADRGVNIARIRRKLGPCGTVAIESIAGAGPAPDINGANRAGGEAWTVAANAARALTRMAGAIAAAPGWIGDCEDAMRYALAHRFYDARSRFAAARDGIASAGGASIVLATRDATLFRAVNRWLQGEGVAGPVHFWIEDESEFDRFARTVPDTGPRLVEVVEAAFRAGSPGAAAAVPVGDWYLLIIDLYARGARYAVAGKALIAAALERARSAGVIQRYGGDPRAEAALRDVDPAGRCVFLAGIGAPVAAEVQAAIGIAAAEELESAGRAALAPVESAADAFLCGAVMNDFARETLPGLFRDCRALNAVFSARPPRAAVACPADSFEWRLVVPSARRHGIPTLGFANMFPSATPLQQRPPADLLAVRDRASARHFGERFDIGPDRMRVAGSPELESLRRSADAHGPGSQGSRTFRILVATQPGYRDRFLDIIDCVGECTRGMDSVCTIVRPHPAEMDDDVSAYRDACARRFPVGGAEVDRERPWITALVEADVLVTLFSNAALEAAALGKHAVIMNLRRERLPIALASLGLGTEVTSREEAAQITRSLIEQARSSTGGRSLQAAAFFAENPELLEPGAAGRILEFVDAAGAG